MVSIKVYSPPCKSFYDPNKTFQVARRGDGVNKSILPPLASLFMILIKLFRLPVEIMVSIEVYAPLQRFL